MGNNCVDQCSEPRAFPGQDPSRFLAAPAERCFDALRLSLTPTSPLGEKPQSSRSIAAERWQSRDEFLAILAHELRNPLMPIRCALEVIDKAKGDPLAVEQAFAIVKRQFAHMVRLVDDMFDAGAIARGGVMLRKERIDLHGVLRCAVEAVQPLIDAKQHQFELLLPLTAVNLQADEIKLTQIVTNLLTNAVKYTPAGGRIWLSAQGDGDRGEVQVRIRDTGIGIPVAELHRIFDMFARVEDGHAERCAGLGIGLALSRELATLHGGSISAHSEGPGFGSEFVLTLPVAVSGRASTIKLRTAPVIEALGA
ncbi:MAG: HAMP domain-containing histidine kinase [Burkholderiaceae bacterium]|nr:HAMP domain-containing histidine kinase [Burkholderiaceae bacterium]